MLTALRSKASSWVVKGLFVLLAMSFVVWGVNDFLRQAGETERTVATVGGKKIMASELRQRFNELVSDISRRSGITFDAEQAKQYGLDKAALQQAIEDHVYSAYGAELGIRLPSEMIDQRVMSFPDFQDQFGQFDPQRFGAFLRNSGMSEAQFKDQLRVAMIKSFVVGSISNGVGTPKTLAETLYAARGEQRVAKTLLIADSSITEQFTPDEPTLKTFHETNSGNYQAPEYRSVTLVRLDPESFVDQVQVSDEEITQTYENQTQNYGVPESRDIDTVTYPDEAAAKAAFDLLKQGRTLADVAQSGGKSVEPHAAISLDGLAKLVGDEPAKTIFAAGKSVTTDPIQTANGWMIAQTTNITPASQKTLDEVKDEIKHELALAQAQDIVLEKGDEFEDQRGSGQKLEEAARTLNLPVTTIAATDQSGHDESAGEIAGVAGDQDLLKVIWDTDEGQETRLEDGGNGVYFALRVDKITPAATRPLEKIRDKVVADWQTSKRREAAAAKAQDLAQRIQGGETLDKIAAELGATVQTSTPFTRQSSDPTADLSPTLISKAFELKVGDVASGRAAKDDGELLFVLSEITPVDISKRSPEIADLREQMKGSIADDLSAQLSSAVRNEVGVTIDQGVVDTLF